MRQQCKAYPGGFYFFTKAILGRNKVKKHLHYAWANYLQLHPRVGSFGTIGGEGPPESLRKTGIMPREHFKSTFCSESLPLWLLACVDRNLTIALVSAHSDNTKKWLRFIKTVIEYNPLFRWVFPDIRRGDKWDETEITVTRDTNQAQASITALSLHGGLASQHFDYIIVDDPVNEQIARSDREMDSAVNYYVHLEEVLKGKKTSAFLLVGTPWGREDVLQKAKDEVRAARATFWKVGVLGEFEVSDNLADRPELRPEVTDGEFILPEEFGPEDRERVKNQSREKWAMQYLCKPFAEDQNGFKLGLIRDFALHPDGRLKCQCHRTHDHRMHRGSTVLVGDPAYSKDKLEMNCESAILVGNLQPCGCRFLLDEWGDFTDPKGYLERVGYMVAQWQEWLGAVGLESEALQFALLQWLKEMQAHGKLPLSVAILEEIKPKNRSKDSRIAGQITPVANGYWHKLPTNTFIEGQNNLLQQLHQWPYSRKRDRADAFSYFEDAWAEFPVPPERPEAAMPSFDLNDALEDEGLRLIAAHEDA